MYYIISLCLLLLAYVVSIFLMKYMKNVKLWNIVFAVIICLSYITVVVYVYFDAGVDDWNFRNTLPTANVSPFMFAITPIILILPKKIKKYFLVLIALLSVGMFLSTIYGCVYNAVINYKFHFHFLLDYIAHFAMSLWGVYLVKSKQVDLNVKNCLISSAILYAVITTMLIVNVICDTAFFGLSLNGKHNIYNMVLVSNSYFSAFLYFLGVGVVLLLGFLFQKMLNCKQSS